MEDPKIVPLEVAWPILQRLCPPVIDGRPASFDDVQREIDAGRAVALANSDGILLLALEPGLDENGHTLIAWCAVASPTCSSADVRNYLVLVEAWAVGMGARRVVFQSPRLGWLRRLPERWRVTSVTYELEVGNVESKQGHDSRD